MPLTAGTRLGLYEILAPIGAGGMGEVYRARDPKLEARRRDQGPAGDLRGRRERLRRFEQEAQAAGALNHPNITAVYELGSHDGSPYIVTELLEGETLRGRLSGGALPVRKATDYAIQTAKGLAAAHEKGIVHRDLKPENVFVTNDGRIKILDFGLAKLTQADGATGPQTNLPTAAGTEPGVVMGTLGYMSPEQVKGKAADARSDIFSFGAILYEMLSGSRAFHRDTAAETMSAILREEPPDLSATNKNVQPGLERVVRHCLEKSPEERFHSAHDLAFDLESLSGTSSTAISAAPVEAKRAESRYPLWRGRSRARGRPRRGHPHRTLRAILRAGDVQAAHVPARHHLVRPIRRGRQDDPLLRRLGRPAGRGLHEHGGRARVPAIRRAGRRRGGRLAVRRRGPAPQCPLRWGLREDRDAGAGFRGGRRASRALREGAVRRLFARRQGPRHRASRGGKVPPRVPAGQGALRDGRMDRQPAVLSERRSDRFPRPSRGQR